MSHIPLFIMEEHSEAFFVWHYARLKKMMAATNNTLLHVDEHSDMGVPTFSVSINALNGNLRDIYEFTQNELSIGSFILPAVYQGMLAQAYWLRRRHNASRPKQEDMVVWTKDRDGKSFSLDENGVKPSAKSDAKSASYYRYTVADDFPSGQSVILDIDLDYFSTSISLMKQTRLEITRAEYESYYLNRYHLLRISGLMQTKVTVEDGKYYLNYNYMPEEIGVKATATEEAILDRINHFADFLRRNEIKPQIIDICRSRHSGYTAEDQWEFIEQNLVAKLRTFYELEVEYVHDLFVREKLN